MKNAAAVGYRNLTRILSRPDGLLERAEAALRQTVALAPDDAGAWRRLGDVQRSKGRLDHALECYQRALSLRPDDADAAWLAAVLGGKALPAASARAKPVPFARQAGFLPRHRVAALLAFAPAQRERFKAGRVGAGASSRVDPQTRTALVEREATVREVLPWLEPRLRRAFTEVLRQLRLPEPSAYWVETALAAYLPGDFFAKHTDTGTHFGTRRLSFAYYFHRQPRAFAGGDLLLHDTHGSAYTRIEPAHNSIVFFPSVAVHQITPVESARPDAGSGEDLSSARFAIHGWLRTYSAKRAAPAAPRAG